MGCVALGCAGRRSGLERVPGAYPPRYLAARRKEIEQQLLAYCRQNTLALVRVLKVLRR
jgi:hypothetical protein